MNTPTCDSQDRHVLIRTGGGAWVCKYCGRPATPAEAGVEESALVCILRRPPGTYLSADGTYRCARSGLYPDQCCCPVHEPADERAEKLAACAAVEES